MAAMSEPTRVGKRGTIVLPASLRKQYGFEEGTMVVAEGSEYGVLLRPAVLMPVEIYTPERKAEFLRANAISAADLASAEAEIRKDGLERPVPKRRARRRRT